MRYLPFFPTGVFVLSSDLFSGFSFNSFSFYRGGPGKAELESKNIPICMAFKIRGSGLYKSPQFLMKQVDQMSVAFRRSP
jgi:hypothetical protein